MNQVIFVAQLFQNLKKYGYQRYRYLFNQVNFHDIVLENVWIYINMFLAHYQYRLQNKGIRYRRNETSLQYQHRLRSWPSSMETLAKYLLDQSMITFLNPNTSISSIPRPNIRIFRALTFTIKTYLKCNQDTDPYSSALHF